MRYLIAIGLASLVAGCAAAPPPASSELENEVLRHRVRALETELHQIWVALAEMGVVDPRPTEPPKLLPKLDSRVLAATDDEPPRIRLASGAAHGVEAGFPFAVYRGNEFIGKVVVERVDDITSEARPLFTAKGKRLAAGDAAATRLD